MYTYIYIHTYIHMYIYIYRHTHMYLHTLTDRVNTTHVFAHQSATGSSSEKTSATAIKRGFATLNLTWFSSTGTMPTRTSGPLSLQWFHGDMAMHSISGYPKVEKWMVKNLQFEKPGWYQTWANMCGASDLVLLIPRWAQGGGTYHLKAMKPGSETRHAAVPADGHRGLVEGVVLREALLETQRTE